MSSERCPSPWQGVGTRGSLMSLPIQTFYRLWFCELNKHASLSGTEVLIGKQLACCATRANASAAGRSSSPHTSGNCANSTSTQRSAKCSHISCTVPKQIYMDKRDKIHLLFIEHFSHMQKMYWFCCFPLYQHPECISRSSRSWAIFRLVQVVYRLFYLLQETHFDPQTTLTPRHLYSRYLPQQSQGFQLLSDLLGFLAGESVFYSYTGKWVID